MHRCEPALPRRARSFLTAGRTRVCAATFYPVSHAAAFLMVPLLAWVSYATALNAKILDMNRRKRD